MYDILGKMNLLEGRGSKPDFLDLDRDGNKTEPMKAAAADSGKPKKAFSNMDEANMDESALQAYLGKKKYGDAGMKALQKAGREGASKEKMASIRAQHDKMDEADMEEGNRFTGNLMKARAAGKKMADLDGDGDMEPVREYEFDDRDDFDRRARPGDTVKTTKGTLKKTDRGVQHTRRYDDDNKGSDDDYDEHGNLKPGRKDASAEKRGRGRPKGTKHAIGAKGPSGKSKLLKKGAIREDGIDDEGISLVDKGEYDREGDMAKEQLHTIKLAARELASILSDDENLPEWVQSKITKAMDYIDTARDYMIANKADGDMQPVAEKAVSKNQAVAARIARGVQKGEIKSEPGTASAEMARMRPKELKKFAKTDTKGLPKKVKAETAEESTVAGSVATSPATGKGKKGMIFGKGVYESQITESYNRRLSEVLTEGISINLSMGENGERNLSVQASDEDAVKLAQILKLAGMGQSDGYQHMEEDLANAPEAETQTADYMTKTIAGGLNKQKRDIAGNGQTTVPVTAVRVQEAEELESHLSKLYQQYKA